MNRFDLYIYINVHVEQIRVNTRLFRLHILLRWHKVALGPANTRTSFNIIPSWKCITDCERVMDHSVIIMSHVVSLFMIYFMYECFINFKIENRACTCKH